MRSLLYAVRLAAAMGTPSKRCAGRRGARARRSASSRRGRSRRGAPRGTRTSGRSRKRTLKAFAIDATEVTRGEYGKCVAAKKCKLPPVRSARRSGFADDRCRLERRPDLSVGSRGAVADRGEWEKAARGDDGREYPWGNDADCARANWGNFEGEGPCADKNPGRPVTVGKYPTGASPYGVLDLGGNVWEWVADKYDEDPKRRVVRGGSCCSFFVGPRAANRNAWSPQHRDGDLGFRCAR